MPALFNSNNGVLKDSFISGQNSEGVEFRGTLLRISRLAAVFEIYNPGAVLRFSESLGEFKITFNDQPVYSGKAVVRNLMNTSPAVMVCEVTLSESSWHDLDFSAANSHPGRWQEEYRSFLADWQKLYKIRPEYKLVLSDMQTYFTDLQLWLSHVELGIKAAVRGDRLELEQKIAAELGASAAPTITALFERLEDAIRDLPPTVEPAHQNYSMRQLHPLLLCSPFLSRCFFKPLGYAGDYEMVNMILRNAHEGASLYAKVVNYWFIQQPPAEAHRNRIDYLTRQLVEVTARASNEGRAARVLSVGCGPAQEVQRFLAKYEISNRAQVSLLDFNGETLEYTRSVIEQAKNQYHRVTPVEYIKKSVHHILKETGTSAVSRPQSQYDFVYCAGLFDYLSDQVCQRLMNIMYDWVSPGGLLVSTNVDPSNARRLTMDYVMAWHLIYRNGPQLGRLKPEGALEDYCSVKADATGVNVFLEVTKPTRE